MTALSESFSLTIICDVFSCQSQPSCSLVESENPFLTDAYLIVFQFYNNLIDVWDVRRGEDVVALINDLLMLTWVRTLAEANGKLNYIMGFTSISLQ